MPFIIDGHNLIPHIPSLSLQDIDDEIQLVELLQGFCQHNRKHVEVFFDNSPPGQPRMQNFGQVIAHFIAANSTADDAIHQRLMRLGKQASNWTVVSSDRMVQSMARTYRAKVLPAHKFAQQLISTKEIRLREPHALKNDQEFLSETEVHQWLDIFNDPSVDS